MDIKEVGPNVFAVDREGPASNVGFVRTTEGIVLIDTTSNKEEMIEVMNHTGFSADEVCLVIITHADHDHIGGNTLFKCPKLAHQITLERMAKRAKIAQPSETFGKQHTIEVGDTRFDLIHKGGHKPDSIVVWLPESKVLFAGDLVFEGRYPFISGSRMLTWMKALKWLLSLGAEVIVPGHGKVCGYDAVNKQLTYMEETWARIAEHVAQGHGLKKTLNDPDFPKNEDWIREQLFNQNIKVMYDQLKKG